jgi:hypothetical protein
MTEYQRSGRLEKGEQPAQAAPFFQDSSEREGTKKQTAYAVCFY